jgi:HEPN domain-containing protein
MTKPVVPRELLDPVVRYFKPRRVILFGSAARGEARSDSDIDLLVIVDDNTPAEKLTWRAGYEAQRSYPNAADVFPMRAEIFERDRTVVGTLAAEADSDGIVVYRPSKELPPMKSADPRVRREAVAGWLDVALRDREAAAVCRVAGAALRGIAAFHCQQAIEKLLKGFLALVGKRSRKTPALAQLGAMAEESFPDIGKLVAAAENWSRWAVEYRYPSARGPDAAGPEDDELQRALSVIDALAARLRAANPEPPGG